MTKGCNLWSKAFTFKVQHLYSKSDCLSVRLGHYVINLWAFMISIERYAQLIIHIVTLIVLPVRILKSCVWSITDQTISMGKSNDKTFPNRFTLLILKLNCIFWANLLYHIIAVCPLAHHQSFSKHKAPRALYFKIS